jgi:2-oxoglutarate ferredoxin oxidoreductase subunit delta
VSLSTATEFQVGSQSSGKQHIPSDAPATERAAMAKGSVQIVVERCKACGFCVEFCPTHVLALSSAFNAKGYHTPYMAHPEKCSGCDLCGMYCPDFAIFGFKPLAPEKSAAPGPEAAASAPEAKEEQDAR